MREHKYRAWIPSRKYMGTPFNFRKLALYDPEENPYDKFDSEAIFMQYLEPFGKGMFESDIIEDHNGRGVVKFDEKHAAFVVSYFSPASMVGQAKWFIDYNLRGEPGSIKVIGNIYENPELLKVA